MTWRLRDGSQRRIFRVGCWGLALGLTGCAGTQSTLPHLWDVPLGTPVESHSTGAESASVLEGSLAVESSPTGKGRLWGVRNMLPDKMLGVIASRRTPNGDPFLSLHLKADHPQAEDTAIARQAAPDADSEGQSGDGPSLSKTGQLVGSQTAKASSRPIDENTPLLNQFDRQRDRLLAAIASDQKQESLPLISSGDGQAARRRVEALMDQAREDLDQGRIASAYRTAQSAETIATEAGVVLDDGRQQPAELVRFLRERRVDDIGGATEIPPEESVESAGGPRLDIGETPEIDPKPAAHLETADAGSSGSTRAGNSGADRDPAAQTSEDAGGAATIPGVVEFLPPAPESDPQDAGDRRAALEEGANRRRTPSRTMALAEIVGPSTPLEGQAGDPQFVEDRPRISADEAESPGSGTEGGHRFLPDGLPSHSQSTSQGDSAVENPGGATSDNEGATTPQERKNVDWADVPQPTRKVAATTVSRPVLAGLGIGAAWLVGFMLYRVFRTTNVRKPAVSR